MLEQFFDHFPFDYDDSGLFGADGCYTVAEGKAPIYNRGRRFQ